MNKYLLFGLLLFVGCSPVQEQPKAPNPNFTGTTLSATCEVVRYRENGKEYLVLIYSYRPSYDSFAVSMVKLDEKVLPVVAEIDQ